MPKAAHRHCNNRLMEEDMSESVAVVGEREQLGEATLIKAQLHLEHILLGLGDDLLQEGHRVGDRNGLVSLMPGNFYIPRHDLLAQPVHFFAQSII